MYVGVCCYAVYACAIDIEIVAMLLVSFLFMFIMILSLCQLAANVRRYIVNKWTIGSIHRDDYKNDFFNESNVILYHPTRPEGGDLSICGDAYVVLIIILLQLVNLTLEH